MQPLGRSILALLLGFTPVSAFAGLNPADPGLPAAQAYGVSYDNNKNSSLCIDCHGYSPMSKRSGEPNQGSHFVAHFDGNLVRTTNALNPALGVLKISQWTASGASSKYAKPSPPDVNAVSVTGQSGDMICESCHNLVKNVANTKRLVDLYLPTDPSTSSSPLCSACHAGIASGPPKHHPLTGDTVGVDKEDSNPAGHALNTSHTSHLRASPDPAATVYYPGPNQLICDSCHTPHKGQTAAGARILRRGNIPAGKFMAGNPINVVYENGVPNVIPAPVAGTVYVWDTNNSVQGLDRQFDVEAYYASNEFRLVMNIDPLCFACHK